MIGSTNNVQNSTRQHGDDWPLCVGSFEMQHHTHKRQTKNHVMLLLPLTSCLGEITMSWRDGKTLATVSFIPHIDFLHHLFSLSIDECFKSCISILGRCDDREVCVHTEMVGRSQISWLRLCVFQASGSWDGTVRVWSLQRRECVFVLGGGERVWVKCVAFCRDGSVLASTAEGDKVRARTHMRTQRRRIIMGNVSRSHRWESGTWQTAGV